MIMLRVYCCCNLLVYVILFFKSSFCRLLCLSSSNTILGAHSLKNIDLFMFFICFYMFSY